MFKTKTRSDREYGKGGKLLRDEMAAYKYETEEGGVLRNSPVDYFNERASWRVGLISRKVR